MRPDQLFKKSGMSRSSSASNETDGDGSASDVKMSVSSSLFDQDRRQALALRVSARRLLEQPREPVLELVRLRPWGHLVEPGGDDGDAHLFAQRVVDDGSEDDVRIGMSHLA